MATNPNQTRYGCYVGNIDRTVTLEMLRQVFCQCGTILDCSLNGRDEDPYRYGFIDFASADDRDRAMKYNGFTLVGRKLKVGVSKGNVNRSDHARNIMNNNTMGMGGGGAVGGLTGAAGMSPMAAGVTGLLPQQMVEAQLLLQLVQQGSMDVRNLTPAQQQLLYTALSQNGGGAAATATAAMAGNGGAAVMPSTAAVMAAGAGGAGVVPGVNAGFPPMMPGAAMWAPGMPAAGLGMRGAAYAPMMVMPGQAGAGMGGMMGNPAVANGPRGAAMPAFHHRGPANVLPSEETLKLREVQRKQFLDVVRKEAERYEKKMQSKHAKELAKEGRHTSNSDDSSASDEEEDKHRHTSSTAKAKKAKTESIDGAPQAKATTEQSPKAGESPEQEKKTDPTVSAEPSQKRDASQKS